MSMQQPQQPDEGRFPLSHPAFDVISILYQKSKALEVYDKYLQDVSGDNQLRQVLVNIRHDEQRHVEQLKNHLTRLLSADKPVTPS